jgi:hypothetical protein
MDLISGCRDLFSREFARATFMGYLLGGISLGYHTVFYIIGEKYMGVWRPIGIDFSGMLDGALPFLDPITNAFKASVTEELLFRYFAIAFFIKYFRSRTLALFIPALLWGFGHSDYDVFPFYTRGVELTAKGLIYGYFFIQYGLITTMVAHFVFNSVIDGVPLLQSPDPYYFWSGITEVGMMMIPMMLGIIGTIREKLIVRAAEEARRRLSLDSDKQQ